MSQNIKINKRFKYFRELVNSLNIWDNPSQIGISKTRQYLQSIIISYTFGNNSEVNFGRGVDPNDVDPRDFQFTDKVKLNRKNADEQGEYYIIKAVISTISINRPIKLYFDGIITKEKGLEQNKKIHIKR